MPTVLIADDEPVILKVMGRFLEKKGRTLLFAESADAALRLARQHAPIDVALLDKNLGDGSGVEVARELKAAWPEAEVILITAYASLQSAIEAVKVGAYDYLTKPIEDFEALDLKVSNAEEKVRLGREHRRMVAELAESELRYRQILESTPDALLVCDAEGGAIRDANPAAALLFGRCLDDLRALTAGELLAEPGAAPAGVPDPGRGAPVRFRKPGGESFPAEVRRGELSVEGRTFATLAIRDVSERERLAAERREAEDRLRRAQKMDALGRLAGGIGHDLGNLIGVVTTYAELLLESWSAPSRDDMEALQSAAERAAQLVRQMMTMCRHGPSAPAVVSVNAAVADTVKMLRRTLGEGVEVATRLAAEPWGVRIDPVQLGQVLLNLAVNARDAMPAGGRLEIATENLAGAGGEPGPAESVLLSVSDTGEGMTEDVRQHVFEPFFTTKDPGKGTGLGLSVTYGIVSQAGGTISVESEPGKGTVFRIRLPRAAGGEAGAAASARAAPVRARRTVLVAEDEDALRKVVGRTLEQLGLAVLGARTGEEALALAQGTPVDVLLADVVMPRMSGPDLAAALRRDHADLKVLLMTAFPGDPRAVRAAEAGEAVLHKPFRRSALEERLRALLEA
ncbi:MAG TPA: response regulator [Anaeromyxobacteraceae bacterium]|jgi:PAS domain S-box-containing protein